MSNARYSRTSSYYGAGGSAADTYGPSGGGSAADAYAAPPPGNAPPDNGQNRSSYYAQGYGSGVYGDVGGYGHAAQPSLGPRPMEESRRLPQEEEEEEEEDEDWNIYDDFNNARPLSGAVDGANPSHGGYYDRDSRDYSGAPGSPGGDPYSDYPKRQSLLPADSFGMESKGPVTPGATPGGTGVPATGSGIELVTVPALGAEYTPEEMKRMSRPYKRRAKTSARARRIKGWGKGEYKICGWLSPRVAVFIAFVFFACLGIALYFVIPRVPSFAFLSTNPLEAVPDGASMEVSHAPTTNFSMTMNLNLRADNGGGWIPSKCSSIDIEVRDVTTSRKVGTGTIKNKSFPGRKKTVFQFPVNFEYSALNDTDTTYQNFYKGCGPKYPNSPRPALNLAITLKMHIAGLVGTKGSSTQISNVECPFTLQNNQ